MPKGRAAWDPQRHLLLTGEEPHEALEDEQLGGEHAGEAHQQGDREQAPPVAGTELLGGEGGDTGPIRRVPAGEDQLAHEDRRQQHPEDGPVKKIPHMSMDSRRVQHRHREALRASSENVTPTGRSCDRPPRRPVR